MNKQLYNNMDCTHQCKCIEHGQAIVSALTKRSVSDSELASFLKSKCSNFLRALDKEGRSALHMAASCGRVKLLEWLVRHSTESTVNIKDLESGFTALHRSIFYGQIHAAVALMKYNVSRDIMDKDDYRPLDLALLDRRFLLDEPCDVYVWGTNSNFTLGIDSQQQRNNPELLTCFSRNNISIKQVCLGKFHSVWVCKEGRMWCAGQAGRAGGGQGTRLRPAPLVAPEPCLAAALTLNSTVFLLTSGSVVQYTLSSDGISTNVKQTDVIKLPPIKPLLKLENPIGLCASHYHVAVWNNSSVYTWGINYGQLGHSETMKTAPNPKKVEIPGHTDTVFEHVDVINTVAVGDGATVISTYKGEFFLLYKHIRKKILIKQCGIKQMCVEARVNENGNCPLVTLIFLKSFGRLHIWQSTAKNATRCVFGLNHQICIVHAALTHDAIYFTTELGEAYVGNISRKINAKPATQAPKEKSTDSFTMVTFLEKDECTMVKIKRLPNIHRAMSIAVDSEGLNFVCLQTKPTCGLKTYPELSPSNVGKHMATLMETASEDDILHDVQFKVGQKTFPAHIFIVASNSEHLYKLCQNSTLLSNGKRLVVLENVHPEVFERILKFMYTGTCDVVELGACSLRLRKEDVVGTNNKKEEIVDIFAEDLNAEQNDSNSDISAFEVYKKQDTKRKGRVKQNSSPRYLHCDPVKLVQATAKRLQVMTLHKLLNRFYYKDGTIYLKEHSSPILTNPPCWKRESFPELIDTYVSSKDNILIPAHKCILAARLEYFHGMFSHTWCESETLSTVKLHINSGILLPIINFLYTDTCIEVEHSDSIDFVCSLLMVADQLFITRLKEKCEIALTNIITLRNCAELCQFAHTYNAPQLKQYCMEFISWNMSNLLENKSLDSLEDKLLRDISECYCRYVRNMSLRVITPFSDAPADEVIQECAKKYPVDLDVLDEECIRDDVVEQTKKKAKKRSGPSESEKVRMRYESVGSATSLDVSDSSFNLANSSKELEQGTKDKWIKIPTTQQKQQKNAQTRLKAIINAKNNLDATPQIETYSKLTKDGSSISDRSSTSTSNILSSSEPIIDNIAKSPPGCLFINHFGPKLSQKQRKKLALKGEDGQISLEDYLNKCTMEESVKPKNPWKVCEAPQAASSPNKQDSLQFDQILADQKKQKDDYSRIMMKPLSLTQLEDKAIEELEKFYNVHEVNDELITVKRIELKVSSPQWVHNTSK